MKSSPRETLDRRRSGFVHTGWRPSQEGDFALIKIEHLLPEVSGEGWVEPPLAYLHGGDSLGVLGELQADEQGQLGLFNHPPAYFPVAIGDEWAAEAHQSPPFWERTADFGPPGSPPRPEPEACGGTW